MRWSVLAVKDFGDIGVEVVELVVEGIRDSVRSLGGIGIKDGSSGLEEVGLEDEHMYQK
jgi:hypothetical protein